MEDEGGRNLSLGGEGGVCGLRHSAGVKCDSGCNTKDLFSNR